MAYNIADLFEHAVDAVDDRVALIVDDTPVTYAELEANANRFAHHLAAHGFGRGDHIGIYAQNCREWVEAMLGTFKLRAVPINVNFRYVEDELLYLIDNAGLGALVYDESLAPRVEAVAPKAPKLRHLLCIAPDGYAAAIADADATRNFGARADDDLYVLYTGGTTGMPKGVVWRHQDVFMALGGGIDAYTNEPVTSEHDLSRKAAATESPLVSLCLPPLMHGAAQWSLLRFLFDGSTSVLPRRFDAHDAWRQVERWNINNLMITGDAMGRPLIEALQDLDKRDETPDLSSLVVVASSAVIFSPAVKDLFLERLPNVLLVDAIGSTETGHNGMSIIDPSAQPRTATEMKGGPTVKALRDAVVLDEDLREVQAGSGTIGRLGRRGNVPIGYFKDEEKTRATFVQGPNGDRYVLAGDMARLEEDGSITLLGRGSQCINTGGEKVFPEEVEAALKAHLAVFDAIVVGVPDERWGQRIAAVVELRKGSALTLDGLDAHCRTRLAGYKIPRQLTLVDAVVRSPSGKPDYPWAEQAAAHDASTTVN